ncbi:hypothetical protein F511_40449 [Dorcoceras hygrometricum]|uniref:Uncharacterized protein n=1 Tax=Dorcoceras hygrometricum TaxID=472368 RepID=A0A2Z7C1A8_9LAMI|nr:hypothetical protein F511_40449 [Dorcoceras hygrometricum]
MPRVSQRCWVDQCCWRYSDLYEHLSFWAVPTVFVETGEEAGLSRLRLPFPDRCVVPERSNAIIGVVTDRFVVSEYHRAVMVN